MNNLDEILKTATNEIPGTIACAVIDLKTSVLLGVHSESIDFTVELCEIVAATALDFFRGKGVKTIETAISQQTGREIFNSIKEVQLATDHTHQYMSTLPENNELLLLLMTDKETHFGMGWMNMRSIASKVSIYYKQKEPVLV